MIRKKPLDAIGWREWAELPLLHVPHIKVKVDTGAQTSSLHAVRMHLFTRRGRDYVEFEVHPEQRGTLGSVINRVPVLEYRHVKSSNGQVERRPVIVTDIVMMGQRWPIEVTLTNRANMGFRMLLGRQSFRGRFVVDVGRSYCGGKPAVKKRARV
ncbi:MAG: ATP-dependent zinc protease [Pseudobdellovibrionaceae bacterium]|nr:ATP-dependent zinc protease [Bdellovibrionales bacterium]USN48390.1 MAG: ATP-dependent zinc protease [Pseudobdellovibrionaceae bacterium]